MEGAPQLIVEVAVSSASHDLHDKLQLYERAGVPEYVAWRVVDKAIDANIPVIVLDRNVETERYTQFIGGDNVVIGRAAGDRSRTVGCAGDR